MFSSWMHIVILGSFPELAPVILNWQNDQERGKGGATIKETALCISIPKLRLTSTYREMGAYHLLS